MQLAILFLILIFSIDMVFGLGFRFYQFPYFDMALHFLGGFFVAMFFISFFGRNQKPDKSSIKGQFLIFAFIILGAVIFVGVFWEFAEYLATVFIADSLYQNYGIVCCMCNLDDSVGDLAFDIFGSIIFILLYRIYRVKYRVKS